ncbi:Pentatricopeptide repeat-containing protein, mitochondrial [Sesamum angolense]|uniref:Pentatricopeptide repeat-containing protein, mitochondrial n=1 Tax=Sesamum angolense TaxID=2727404 RepID=A0AAE2BN57_9LAMI|nr:Pentatricopeptide repeat-containing protein, mitochondrial [Sesamum angolense]
MLLRISRAIVFSNGIGKLICWEFIRHHDFSERDALFLIFRGLCNLVLDVLEAFLNAPQSCKPVWRDLDQLGRSLSCYYGIRRYKGAFFSFFFKDIHIKQSGYTSRGIRESVTSWGISHGTDSSRGGGTGAREARGDPPPIEVGGVLVTTYKAWGLLAISTAFCLFAGSIFELKLSLWSSITPSYEGVLLDQESELLEEPPWTEFPFRTHLAACWKFREALQARSFTDLHFAQTHLSTLLMTTRSLLWEEMQYYLRLTKDEETFKNIMSNPNLPYPKSTAKINKFVVYCNMQITSHGRKGNIKEAELLFHRMPEKSIISYTAMLSAYANNGQIANARKLFDEMPQRTVATWNAMITAYVKNMNRVDGVEEAFKLFLQMPVRNAVSYTAMMMGFVNAGRFDEAEKLYKGTPLEWRDPFCSNVLMNGYLKIGKLEESMRTFEGMVKKNVVTWSSMVDGYCKNGKVGHFEVGFQLFSQMRRESKVGIEPTILTIIFESCGRIGRYKEGCQVHGLVSQLGFEFDVFMGNSIIAMYSRFGCVNEARHLFEMMCEKDIVSWNSLIYGYVQAGRLEEAYDLFEKMDAKDSVSWTTLITGFSNKGLTEKCIKLFSEMPERDDVAWTALISGFMNNEEHEKAVCWFLQMIRNSIKPNPLTLISVQNSLVSMYSKHGSVDDAYKIFKSIATPNTVSFNSMIAGFAHNGFGGEALELFRKLVGEGHQPNQVTFLCILSACTHMGLVEEGWEHFKSMRTLFKVEPGPDHFACIVDLLGRAGLLDEAMRLIKSMPVEPHSGVWGALLGASRTHMRLDLAKLAARHILELEPNNAAPYVVLSDIYSFMEKRGDEEQMRLSKKLRGIKKSPGCSWITVRNEECVTTNFAGGKAAGAALLDGLNGKFCRILCMKQFKPSKYEMWQVSKVQFRFQETVLDLSSLQYVFSSIFLEAFLL